MKLALCQIAMSDNENKNLERTSLHQSAPRRTVSLIAGIQKNY